MSCSARRTYRARRGPGRPGTARRAARCGGGWPGSALPGWPCRNAAAVSGPARSTWSSRARSWGIIRCPGRWPSRWRRFRSCWPGWPRRPRSWRTGARAGWPGWRPANCSARWPRHPGCRTRPDAGAAGLVLLAAGGSVWLADAGTRHRSVDSTRWLAECTAPNCWPARTWRPGRCTGRSSSARWPARRNCSARAARCWRPACGMPHSGPSSAARSAASRRSSISWPTWPSGWSSPSRCWTRPPSRSRPAAAPAAEPAGTCPRPRSPAPTPRTGRPAPRCRCTGRSATPRNTTSACGWPRCARWCPPGAARPTTGPLCWPR